MKILVRKSIILKGDGVYSYHGGTPHLMTSPPPEAFHPDPNVPDVPAYAHFGAAKPHPSGHPGMGELIPGDFSIGKHGEHVYIDHNGETHHHGIDGVLHSVGEALERNGMLGQNHPQLGQLTPQALVQRAIEMTNNEHQDKSGFHHIPDVDSMEHRKIRVAGYGGRKPLNRAHRSQSGEYITAYTNRPNRKEKVGAMIESYAVPYNHNLQKILLETLGISDLVGAEFLDNPHIDIADLHPRGRRIRGRGGDVIGMNKRGEYTLPDSHIRGAPKGIVHDAAHTGIQSWEIMNHTPDFMHMMAGRQQTGPKNSIDSAKAHIAEAMKIIDPDKIPDVEVPINTTPGTTGSPQYTMMNLRTVLRSPQMTDNMIGELSRTPAFNMLFGRIISGSAASPGVGKRAFQHILEAFGGDDDSMSFENMNSHTIGGDHLETEDGFRPTQKLGTHKNAAKFYAKAMLSGAHDDHDSALRAYMPRDAEGNIDAGVIQGLGLNLQSYDTVENRRQGTQALADLLSEAFGHQTRRQLPDEIPSAALSSRNVIGYPEQIIESLPEHIPFFTDVGLAPVERAGVAAPKPAVTPPVERPPPRQPQPQPVAVAPPATEALPPPIPQRGAPSFRPQSPELVAARQHVGRADPATLRQIMGAAGARVPQGQGMQLSPQEQRYQQMMGDPRQQLLTQYMKGQDQDLSPMDRVMKAMEQMQIDDARSDAKIMKHALPRQVNIADLHGINHLAKSIDLTPVDVRSIAYSHGDWERIAKKLNVSTDVVKVVKISVGGV